MNEKDIIIKLDGNQWCAHRGDFINLQESTAAFGSDPIEAVLRLLKQETPEKKCSCHINPPCNDCVEHGFARDIIEQYGSKTNL
jgi:hypothetical protein